MFVWAPLFRKRAVTALMGTYIRGVLVNDGYLYSRVYGIFSCIFDDSHIHAHIGPCSTLDQVVSCMPMGYCNNSWGKS